MKLEDNCGTGEAAEALLSKSRRGQNIEVYQREGNNHNGETVVRPEVPKGGK